MTVVFPALIALVGLLMYAFGNSKVSEIGRIVFFCGMLVFTQQLAGKSLRLF